MSETKKGGEGQLVLELIQGDCLEEMKSITEHSVDMVLTDPP